MKGGGGGRKELVAALGVVGEALVRAWLEARDAGFPEEGVVSGAHASSAATRSNAGVGRRNEAGGPKQGCERRGSVAAVLEGGGGGLGDGGGVVPEGVWIPAELEVALLARLEDALLAGDQQYLISRTREFPESLYQVLSEVLARPFIPMRAMSVVLSEILARPLIPMRARRATLAPFSRAARAAPWVLTTLHGALEEGTPPSPARCSSSAPSGPEAGPWGPQGLEAGARGPAAGPSRARRGCAWHGRPLRMRRGAQERRGWQQRTSHRSRSGAGPRSSASGPAGTCCRRRRARWGDGPRLLIWRRMQPSSEACWNSPQPTGTTPHPATTATTPPEAQAHGAPGSPR
ncbi:hypothetical protein T484DRAFT_1876438, partial [Baffinella frigidus]